MATAMAMDRRLYSAGSAVLGDSATAAATAMAAHFLASAVSAETRESDARLLLAPCDASLGQASALQSSTFELEMVSCTKGSSADKVTAAATADTAIRLDSAVSAETRAMELRLAGARATAAATADAAMRLDSAVSAEKRAAEARLLLCQGPGACAACSAETDAYSASAVWAANKALVSSTSCGDLIETRGAEPRGVTGVEISDTEMWLVEDRGVAAAAVSVFGAETGVFMSALMRDADADDLGVTDPRGVTPRGVTDPRGVTNVRVFTDP